MILSVIATGGTVASSKDNTGAAKPTLGGEALLDGLAPEGVGLRIVNLIARDSSGLTLECMQRISDAVAAELADPDVAGIVVLHGTDSMEETALLTALQHHTAKGVVFTGAQFTADHPQSDGAANIRAALEAARRAGVRIVFGGRELHPWGSYKFSTDSADAFRAAAPPAQLHLPQSVAGLRVDIVAVHPGGDGTHMRASLEARAQGIVLCALGSGNATAAIVDAVVAAQVPVVVSSRVPEGVMTPTYGGGGGGHDLQRAGAIHSCRLRSGQARILLAALLANGASGDEIAEAFSR